jgi:hypothetical protein
MPDHAKKNLQQPQSTQFFNLQRYSNSIPSFFLISAGTLSVKTQIKLHFRT